MSRLLQPPAQLGKPSSTPPTKECRAVLVSFKAMSPHAQALSELLYSLLRQLTIQSFWKCNEIAAQLGPVGLRRSPVAQAEEMWKAWMDKVQQLWEVVSQAMSLPTSLSASATSSTTSSSALLSSDDAFPPWRGLVKIKQSADMLDAVAQSMTSSERGEYVWMVSVLRHWASYFENLDVELTSCQKSIAKIQNQFFEQMTEGLFSSFSQLAQGLRQLAQKNAQLKREWEAQREQGMQNLKLQHAGFLDKCVEILHQVQEQQQQVLRLLTLNPIQGTAATDAAVVSQITNIAQRTSHMYDRIVESKQTTDSASSAPSAAPIRTSWTGSSFPDLTTLYEEWRLLYIKLRPVISLQVNTLVTRQQELHTEYERLLQEQRAIQATLAHLEQRSQELLEKGSREGATLELIQRRNSIFAEQSSYHQRLQALSQKLQHLQLMLQQERNLSRQSLERVPSAGLFDALKTQEVSCAKAAEKWSQDMKVLWQSFEERHQQEGLALLGQSLKSVGGFCQTKTIEFWEAYTLIWDRWEQHMKAQLCQVRSLEDSLRTTIYRFSQCSSKQSNAEITKSLDPALNLCGHSIQHYAWHYAALRLSQGVKTLESWRSKLATLFSIDFQS